MDKNISSYAAEEGLLASLLYKPDKIVEIIDEMNPDIFSVKEFGYIYKCIIDLYKDDITPDEVMVINRAVNLGFDITPNLVKKLANSKTFVAKRQIKNYCKIIKSAALKRDAVGICTDFLEEVKDMSGPDKIVDEFMNVALSLQEKSMAENSTSLVCVDKNEVLNEIDFRYNNPNVITGVPFGFPSIDEYIDGAEPCDIITIGGMNGSGKSYFATCILMNMAFNLYKQKSNKKVLFISLEMTKTQVYKRMLSILTGLQSKYFKKPKLYFIENNIPDTKENFDKFKHEIGKATEILNKLPIVIDDSSTLSAEQISGIMKKTMLKSGLVCTFIDYVGLISNDNMEDWQSCVHSYKTFKSIAKTTKTPMIILNQYNKDLKENKADGYRPTMNNLTGGKSAMNDSHKILHMWKPDIHIDYISKNPELKNKFFVLNDKNRDGALGLMPDVALQFSGGALKETKYIKETVKNVAQEVFSGK